MLDGVAIVSLASPGVSSSSSLGLFRLALQVALVGRDMFVCAGVDAVDAGRSGSGPDADAGGGGGAADAEAEAEGEAAAVEGWFDILHAKPRFQDTNLGMDTTSAVTSQPASACKARRPPHKTGRNELKETTSGSM